jgi:hypothetical protein
VCRQTISGPCHEVGKIFFRRRVISHCMRVAVSVQALRQMVKSVDSPFENFPRSNKIPSPEVLSHAAGYALLAIAVSVFAFFPQLFFLDLKVF